MRYVRLTQGKRAMVDDEDYELVSRHKWHAMKASRNGDHELWYATATIGHPKRTLYMHRLITGAAPGEEPDHLNGNGLDNRRGNLRLGSHSDNVKNTYRHRREPVLSLRALRRKNKERMLERLTENRRKTSLTPPANV